MNLNRQLKLNYAEEFRVACTINNLRYGDVLQRFINHVSFYVFNGGEISPVYKWATQVIINCKEDLSGKIVEITSENIQQVSFKYIQLLSDLSNDVNFPAEMKVQKSCAIMRNWSYDLSPLLTYEEELEINCSHRLNLTFDFNLLCSINGVDAGQVLQYFIDNMSLARDRALNLYEAVEINPSTAVLLLLKHNALQKDQIPQEEIYVQYALGLLDLDEELEDESNINSRISAYSAFYLDWYNALSVNVN